jgi:hypothetical protein
MNLSNSWATPITEAAAARAAVEWAHFRESIDYNADEPLGARVRLFARMFKEGLQGIRGCENWGDETVLFVVVMSVEQSGTNTFEELEEALGISGQSGRPAFALSPRGLEEG